MDKRLLEVLACPICKGSVIFDKKNQTLICKIDKLAYPIQDDIPVMLESEAKHLTEDEL